MISSQKKGTSGLDMSDADDRAEMSRRVWGNEEGKDMRVREYMRCVSRTQVMRLSCDYLHAA